MSSISVQTYIQEQPEVLRRLVERQAGFSAAAGRLAPWTFRKIWFVGSGTSLYAAMTAANVWESVLGVDTEAISSLEFLQDVSDRMLGPDTLAVAISQSGATVVLAEGLARARRLGCRTACVTAEVDSLLARTAEVVVNSETGPEEVFAKTKGFTSTALAACLLGLAVARDAGALAGPADRVVNQALAALPGLVGQVIAAAEEQASVMVQRLASVEGLFIVGEGALLPAVYEGSLKLLEVGKLLVEGRDLEEILHGYFNAVGPRVGLVVLAGGMRQPEKVLALQAAAAEVGAPLVTIAADSLVPSVLRSEAVALLLPDPGVDWLAPILGVLPLQILAYHLAIARGIDPNRTRYPSLYGVFRTKTIHM